MKTENIKFLQASVNFSLAYESYRSKDSIGKDNFRVSTEVYWGRLD